jgi:PII-like signaling protein
MSDESLKLTTYFGERDRTPTGLLGDELLGLYARHRIRASVLLRGAEGFGAHHRLRSDRLLTLSEDLPVVSVAVDLRERVEALVEPVLALQRRGFVTLERARLVGGAEGADDEGNGGGDLRVGGVTLPQPVPLEGKLTVYLPRRARARGVPTFVAVCELLHRRGLDGASVLLGVDGTRGGERARARFFSRNADVPVMVIAVGASERIAAALPELAALVGDAPLTFERVRVCKRNGRLLARPHELPAADASGRSLWQKLMVYTSQSATHEGRPLSREIVRRLREAGAAGATTLHGIWGFHGADAPHGDRLLQVRRRVPALTIAIGAPGRIARVFAIVDELTAEHGLVTSEMVPALRAGTAESTNRAVLDLAEHGF